MQGFIIAMQFLTRLPMPRVKHFDAAAQSASVAWFPVVGLVIGLLLVVVAQIGLTVSPMLAALLVLLAWVWVTGALHLDGVADLADALAASHKMSNEEKPVGFQALKDPHVGAFGVIALVLVLLSKLVLLVQLFEIQGGFLLLVLIPACARFAVILWGRTLPAITDGWAARMFSGVSDRLLWGWALLLSLLVLGSGLWWMAVMSTALWWWFLKWRMGGMNGDALGAGIETVECLMLLLWLLMV